MGQPAIWSDWETANDASQTLGAAELKLVASEPQIVLQYGPRTTLSLLAHVQTAHVPLHQIVGPPQVCWTDKTNTEAWLSRYLLSFDSTGQQDEVTPWWASDAQESDSGVLLKVCSNLSAWRDGPAVTEVLLYAVRLHGADLPSPAAAAQHLPRADVTDPLASIQVRAVPLSSRSRQAVSPEDAGTKALADGTGPILGIIVPGSNEGTSLTVVKQQRLSSLFEQAALQRKKPKTVLKDAVATTKDDIASAAKSNSLERADKAEESNSFEISSGAASLAHLSQVRPVTLQGSLGITSEEYLVRPAGSGGIETGLPGTDDLSLRNKTALQRSVLTGMRMYGLQQRKQPRTGEVPSQSDVGIQGFPIQRDPKVDEDEYKSIYHQTYRAAFFALRNHFQTVIINQDAMRTVVEQLLALFCRDPLQSLPDSVHNSFASVEARFDTLAKSTSL